MRNCNETKVFLEEWERMCKEEGMVLPLIYSSKEKIIDVVQKWSDEHQDCEKKNTFIDEIMKQWPNINKKDFMVSIHKCSIFKKDCNLVNRCLNEQTMIDCWNKAYEENDNK